MILKKRLRTQGDFLFRWRSYLPLLLVPPELVAVFQSGYIDRWLGEPIDEMWRLFCLSVSVSGLAVRALTVGFVPSGTSGRNTSEQRASALNTTGMYSIVRNPLYLGNALVLFGIVLVIKTWWLVLLTGLGFVLYYERIIYAEEDFLRQKFGETYLKWVSRTPLFIPDPRLWRRAELSFSLRTVLRREYNGFYTVVVAFTLLDILDDVLVVGVSLGTWLERDFLWLVFFGIGTLIFLTLRSLKKHTHLLRVPGR